VVASPGVRIETARLLIESVGPGDDPDDFLTVFNSNAGYLDASEGKRAYERGDVDRYLYTESSRENGRCLAVRRRQDGAVVGTAALLVPHPAGCSWIGLLIVRGDEQGHGLGREAALAIEAALAREGWSEMRLGVLKNTERARSFWETGGYAVIDETKDAAGRPCWVLSKRIALGASPAAASAAS
jgi:GNAT superfamily N-acetyltransferase